MEMAQVFIAIVETSDLEMPIFLFYWYIISIYSLTLESLGPLTDVEPTPDFWQPGQPLQFRGSLFGQGRGVEENVT